MSVPESDTEIITTHELLEQSARAALKLQRGDGSFPPGRNGVYDEGETPVRTTSHWLTTLSKVYENTGDEVFSEAANDAADYLLSDEARPYGYTFHSRNAEGKDKCDGLVGQAAPIRALARAGSVFKRSELTNTAKEVFSSHPFNTKFDLWEKVEIDGKVLSFDRTLNHQISFAAAASNITELSSDLKNRIISFLDGIKYNMETHSNGIIQHYIRPPITKIFQADVSFGDRYKLLLNEIAYHYRRTSAQFRKKEVGYHPVNIRGLGILKQEFPNHSIWTNKNIDSAVGYVKSASKYESILNMDRGSGLPGIDIAFGLIVFTDSNFDKVKKMLEYDLENKYDFETNMMVNNATDPALQAASVYRLAFFPELEIRIVS